MMLHGNSWFLEAPWWIVYLSKISLVCYISLILGSKDFTSNFIQKNSRHILRNWLSGPCFFFLDNTNHSFQVSEMSWSIEMIARYLWLSKNIVTISGVMINNCSLYSSDDTLYCAVSCWEYFCSSHALSLGSQRFRKFVLLCWTNSFQKSQTLLNLLLNFQELVTSGRKWLMYILVVFFMTWGGLNKGFTNRCHA